MHALALRLICVVFGGYAFFARAVALLGVTLTFFGVTASEAVLFASMLGFLFYLALILWGFHERSLVRVAAVIGGGAVLTIGAAALFAPTAV